MSTPTRIGLVLRLDPQQLVGQCARVAHPFRRVLPYVDGLHWRVHPRLRVAMVQEPTLDDHLSGLETPPLWLGLPIEERLLDESGPLLTLNGTINAAPFTVELVNEERWHITGVTFEPREAFAMPASPRRTS